MTAAQKPITTPRCVCVKCQHEQFPRLYYMPICPECGDKRCDKAENHENECQATKGEGYDPHGIKANHRKLKATLDREIEQAIKGGDSDN